LGSPTSPILYTVDKDTGSVLTSNIVTGHEALFGGLAADGRGNLYSIDGFNDGNSDRLFRIDPATGVGVVVGHTRENWNFRSVYVHPGTGTIYGMRDNALYELDGSTGLATHLTNISGPTLDQITAFAIDDAGTFWATDIGGAGMFTVDPASGQATHIGDLIDPSLRQWYNDLAFDDRGQLWGVFNQGGGIYRIDTSVPSHQLVHGGSYTGLAFEGDGGVACYPDCDGNGTLDFFDFLCFQNAFLAADPYADCDGNGVLDFFDFLCFQNEFLAGCP
jgi:hypothetical protein